MADAETVLTVATSLNPFSRAEAQLRCFHAFRALGVRILTANTDGEADRLLDMGLKSTDILRLSPHDTGQQTHGKPVPKITAVLRRLQEQPGSGPVALVNSDLYPAMRSPAGLSYWLDHFPAAALSREDCIAPEIHRYGDQSPYRGGLDAFVFSRPALGRILALADSCVSAERMCFGIIGWDYVMGALILSDGGGFADSRLLLHERHPTTYSNMDEFAHYLPDMQRFAGITTPDPTEAAATFQPVIDRECDRTARHSQRAQTMFFAAPDPGPLPGRAALAVADRLLRLSPALSRVSRRAAIAALAARAIAAGSCDLTASRDLFEVNPDPHYRFSQRLLAILFCLELRAAMPQHETLTETYPPGNQHGEAIARLRDLHADDPMGLRLEIALVFGSELAEYGIFNPRLFNYLVQCCETDDERRLLSEILSHTERLSDAA